MLISNYSLFIKAEHQKWQNGKIFFQFNEGDTFKIIEEDNLIGDGSANYIFDAIGKVEEISSSLLTLGFDINQQDMPTSGLLRIITGKSILPLVD